MRIKTALIILGLVLLAAAESFAGTPICTCRYAGQSYLEGTCVCIVMSNGARRACCNKVLNNTSWNFKGETCPVASAPGQPLVAETPPPGAGTQAPESSGRPASAQALRPLARL